MTNFVPKVIAGTAVSVVCLSLSLFSLLLPESVSPPADSFATVSSPVLVEPTHGALERRILTEQGVSTQEETHQQVDPHDIVKEKPPIEEEPRITIEEEPHIEEKPRITTEPLIEEEPHIATEPLIEEELHTEEDPLIEEELIVPEVTTATAAIDEAAETANDATKHLNDPEEQQVALLAPEEVYLLKDFIPAFLLERHPQLLESFVGRWFVASVDVYWKYQLFFDLFLHAIELLSVAMLVHRYLLPSTAKPNEPEYAHKQLATGVENTTRWTELENTVDQLREQLRSHTDRSLATQETHHTMVSKLTEEFARQQANNESLQKDKRTAHLALHRLATERRTLSAQLDAALAHTERLDLDKRQLATELESSHRHLQSAQKQLDAALASVQRVELDRRQLTSELETSRKQLQDSEQESTQLRTKLDELEKACEAQRERIRIHEQHHRRDSDKIQVLQRKSRDLTDQLEFHESGLSYEPSGLSSSLSSPAPAPPTPVSSPCPSRRAEWSRSSSSGLLPTSPSASTSTISPRLRRTLSLVNAQEGQQRGITTPITDYDELVNEYESLQLDCDSLEQLAQDMSNQFFEEQRRCQSLQAEVKALCTENRELSYKAEQLTEQLADVQEELAIYRDSATASTEVETMSSAETTSGAHSATASSAKAEPHSDEPAALDLALSDPQSTHTDQKEKDDCLEIEQEREEDNDDIKVAKSYLRKLRTGKESLKDIRTADSVHELFRRLQTYES